MLALFLHKIHIALSFDTTSISLGTSAKYSVLFKIIVGHLNIKPIILSLQLKISA
jgi:hypothetical protein